MTVKEKLIATLSAMNEAQFQRAVLSHSTDFTLDFDRMKCAWCKRQYGSCPAEDGGDCVTEDEAFLAVNV